MGKLSPVESRSSFAEKPCFEHWDGEAVQKTIPTQLHSLIQEILVRLLDGLGYDADRGDRDPLTGTLLLVRFAEVSSL
jgi:hypothetical protein